MSPYEYLQLPYPPEPPPSASRGYASATTQLLAARPGSRRGHLRQGAPHRRIDSLGAFHCTGTRTVVANNASSIVRVIHVSPRLSISRAALDACRFAFVFLQGRASASRLCFCTSLEFCPLRLPTVTGALLRRHHLDGSILCHLANLVRSLFIIFEGK